MVTACNDATSGLTAVANKTIVNEEVHNVDAWAVRQQIKCVYFMRTSGTLDVGQG